MNTFLRTGLTAGLLLAGALSATAHDYTAGDLEIGHPWTRATLPNANVAGGYLSIENTGEAEDRLTGATSPMSGLVEIHEMAMENDVMTMRELPDGIAIPAGETVALEPGGYHLMLVNLNGAIAEGDMVPVTLTFENAGEVEVELAATAPGGAMDHSGHGGDGAEAGESHQGH